MEKNDNYDSWSDLRSLQNEINDLFDTDRYPAATGLFDRRVSPAMDVFEDENEYRISCELPGLEKEDVEITIASNVLTIKGIKKEEKEAGNGSYYKKETWSGSFQRTLPLPVSVSLDKINAELKNGILNVMLPKKDEAKPRQISVNIN